MISPPNLGTCKVTLSLNRCNFFKANPSSCCIIAVYPTTSVNIIAANWRDGGILQSVMLKINKKSCLGEAKFRQHDLASVLLLSTGCVACCKDIAGITIFLTHKMDMQPLSNLRFRGEWDNALNVTDTSNEGKVRNA